MNVSSSDYVAILDGGIVAVSFFCFSKVAASVLDLGTSVRPKTDN
ncbi:MAG: hypothetical protein M0T73_12520 [Deltaproteobacteria bacterium]|nr:hypothetical protein [Deltaproteobacteria bacterium]